MVAGLVCEADDLVFDAGAVARPEPFDEAGIHGRAVETRADDVVGRFGGAGEVAAHLREDRLVVVVGEAAELLVAGLRLQRGPVDGASIEARCGAGLEAAHIELQRAELVGEAVGGLVAGAAALEVLEAHVAEAAEEGARGEDDGACGVAVAEPVFDAATDLASVLGLEQEPLDGALFDVEVGDRHQEALHLGAVDLHVGLGARGADGGALLGVEVFEVDGGAVGEAAHDAAHGVDLTDQLPLGLTADGGVAGHVADGVDVHRQQERAAAHDGERVRCFAASVAAANDDGVVSGGVVEHGGARPVEVGEATSRRAARREGRVSRGGRRCRSDGCRRRRTPQSRRGG